METHHSEATAISVLHALTSLVSWLSESMSLHVPLASLHPDVTSWHDMVYHVYPSRDLI